MNKKKTITFAQYPLPKDKENKDIAKYLTLPQLFFPLGENILEYCLPIEAIDEFVLNPNNQEFLLEKDTITVFLYNIIGEPFVLMVHPDPVIYGKRNSHARKADSDNVMHHELSHRFMVDKKLLPQGTSGKPAKKKKQQKIKSPAFMAM